MPDSREPDAHARAHKIRVQCEINGRAMTLETYSMARLLDVLREQPDLTGTKEGCGEGECGACAVELEGALVNSCLVPAIQADGARIRTIEGVADSDSLLQDNPFHNDPLLNERLHAVQQAFLAHGGAQCGICTPGMILAAVNLLDRNPHPSEAEIREGLAGNLCRCTGYTKIFESVVAAFRSGQPHAEPRH
jgi:carbon-monoxide dehydrogenase small subunit